MPVQPKKQCELSHQRIMHRQYQIDFGDVVSKAILIAQCMVHELLYFNHAM